MNLRTKFMVLLFCTLPLLFTEAQTVDGIVNALNPTDLTNSLSIISGETSTTVDGAIVTISERKSITGRTLAADYLEEQLENLGLEVENHAYRTNGRNVIATQTGTEYPDSVFIICAHYDAVANYCADDNGSGTVAVLEAARLLSVYEFPYTLKYAFWDEEELGLIGSNYYATKAKSDGDLIIGVINLDMIAYDSDDDGISTIHINSNSYSLKLKDRMLDILDMYHMDTNPIVRNPGLRGSDHSSFWDNGYGSILLIENSGSDFNAFYHTDNDRMNILNMPYYYELSKLAIGTFASLAMYGYSDITGIETQIQLSDGIMLFPNPADTYINMQHATVGSLVRIYSMDGRLVLQQFIQSSETSLDIQGLAAGSYLFQLVVDDQVAGQIIMVQ